jgi:CBS domain-containing protein
MARYRSDMEDDRGYEMRERFGRERPWNYNDPYDARNRSLGDYRTNDYGRGRFGERASYEYDEPRYIGDRERYREEDYRRPSYDRAREYPPRRAGEYERGTRSRLRCRDIMTRELAVATRDTTLREVAQMMKHEDTGVIPVVDYDLSGGDGRTKAETQGVNRGGYNHGRLVGLITDRDIVIRAVAEDRDCGTTRAEELMSTDLHVAKPNDRIVDMIKKMGDKQVRRIPVVAENGMLRGIISLGDVALETEQDQELADALEDISKSSSFWTRMFG